MGWRKCREEAGNVQRRMGWRARAPARALGPAQDAPRPGTRSPTLARLSTRPAPPRRLPPPLITCPPPLRRAHASFRSLPLPPPPTMRVLAPRTSSVAKGLASGVRGAPSCRSLAPARAPRPTRRATATVQAREGGREEEGVSGAAGGRGGAGRRRPTRRQLSAASPHRPASPLPPNSQAALLPGLLPLAGRAIGAFVLFYATANWVHYRGTRKQVGSVWAVG